MRERFKKLFWKYFDYDIVHSVYDSDGHGHYRIRHVRKYKLRKRRK